MVLKKKAPVSNDVLKVKLPRPQEVDLPNGLHLMVLEDHRLPQVTFTLIIPGAGGYFDPTDKIGLASYTASLMREGTKTRTSPQISEALETMAASLTVTSGLSRTHRIGQRECVNRKFRQADGSHRRRAVESIVRPGGMGSLQDTHQSWSDSAANEPGLSGN